MAEVVKHSGGVSLSSLEPPAGDRLPLQSDTALLAGDACYVKSNGLAAKSTNAADDEKSIVRGFALRGVPAGGDITLLMVGQRMNYSDGNLIAGQNLFLSGTIAGGLADTPFRAGDLPVAFAVDTQRIQIIQGRVQTIALMRAV